MQTFFLHNGFFTLKSQITLRHYFQISKRKNSCQLLKKGEQIHCSILILVAETNLNDLNEAVLTNYRKKFVASDWKNLIIVGKLLNIISFIIHLQYFLLNFHFWLFYLQYLFSLIFQKQVCLKFPQLMYICTGDILLHVCM